MTSSDLYFTVILLAAVEDRGKGNESESRVISEGASVGDGPGDDLWVFQQWCRELTSFNVSWRNDKADVQGRCTVLWKKEPKRMATFSA